MNGKQLRNSILQWAIQGKLVPQDPNEEPASVLLERIRAEKAKLVKEKKIKKDKNESIIYRGDDNSYYEKFLATGEVKCIDEEIPFEIPKGWEWSRMGSIGDWGAGATPAKGNTSYYGGNILWLRTGELNNSIVNDTEIKITDKALKECSLRMNKAGDVLIAMYGATIGKVAIAGCELTTNQACCACTPIGIFNYYLFYFLMESQVDFIKKGEGGAQPNISREKLVAHLMPIPPIQEQHRIVERIKDVLPLIDKYALSQIALDELNRSINDKLKKSILQEAIQGKLVPQIVDEGTAQELLEQIKLEKQKLVKDGKLKKSALTDSIIFKGDDNKYYERINAQTVEIELPFEYPNNWSVLRLKDICQLIDGEKRNGKGICLDAKYLRGKSSATIVEKGKFVYAGDNIILVDGENSGEVFTVPQDGYMGSTFKQLWLSSAMWKPYILAFILFYKEDLRNSKRGAAIPHLNKELFYNLPIGIPPYQEQQRIAKRINELSQLLK
jgi:type I restriction enzyme S subunit